MEQSTKFKVLDLLLTTGSTSASEIRTEFNEPHPHRVIYSLRKMGVPISNLRLFGNEKVYFIKSMFKYFKPA